MSKKSAIIILTFLMYLIIQFGAIHYKGEVWIKKIGLVNSITFFPIFIFTIIFVFYLDKKESNGLVAEGNFYFQVYLSALSAIFLVFTIFYVDYVSKSIDIGGGIIILLFLMSAFVLTITFVITPRVIDFLKKRNSR